uniref:Uncharacterized protein LOC114324777 n=1 Tax=Diabrotica virgifera virgifera TaxID=50390 RepID=A0A6P7F4M9_DIAVI
MVTAKLEDEKIKEVERKDYQRVKVNKLKLEQVREHYKEETNRRLRQLENQKETWTLEERWNAFKVVIKSTATEICGIRKHNKLHKRTRWWNNEVKTAVKKKKIAWKKYIETELEEDKEEYKRLRRLAKNTIKQVKTKNIVTAVFLMSCLERLLMNGNSYLTDLNV